MVKSPGNELVKTKGLRKVDKKRNLELMRQDFSEEMDSSVALFPRTIGESNELDDVIQILQSDPVSISGLSKNNYGFYVTKQDVSIAQKRLIISIDLNKTFINMMRTRNVQQDYITLNRFAMIWLGLRPQDDGKVEVMIVDESIMEASKSIIQSWEGRAGDMWGCIGGMNNYIAREDCDKLKVYIKVNGSNVANAIISRAIFMWGVEETNIPVQTKKQSPYLVNFEPVQPRPYKDLRTFKDLAKALLTDAHERSEGLINDEDHKGSVECSDNKPIVENVDMSNKDDLEKIRNSMKVKKMSNSSALNALHSFRRGDN